jgi:hypothetical protein
LRTQRQTPRASAPSGKKEKAMFTLNDFRKSHRVELHPATDAWMMGDRFGAITRIGRKYLSILMDRSGKVRKVTPDNIYDIVGGFGYFTR